jgi:hypothetical protein
MCWWSVYRCFENVEWPISSADSMDGAESHALCGAIDAGALDDFRTEFERLEPLASGSLDDVLSPGELRLQLDDGVGGATHATLTVR